MDATLEIKTAELLLALVSVASVAFCWGILAAMWPKKGKKGRSNEGF